MFRKMFGLLTIIALLLLGWVSFALWAGFYAIYTVPPSPSDQSGATMLVSRDEEEPLFDSPDHVQPPAKHVEESGVVRFSSTRVKRPIDQRTIVKLPYIDWAYQKSIEKAQVEP